MKKNKKANTREEEISKSVHFLMTMKDSYIYKIEWNEANSIPKCQEFYDIVKNCEITLGLVKELEK